MTAALVVGTPSAAFGAEPPPGTDPCQGLSTPCYTPQQIQAAYGADTLQAQGLTGQGMTIVTGYGQGSTTIQQDLDTYSAATGLPPTTLQFVQSGSPTPSPVPSGELDETTTDVQAIHTMAPGAQIVVVQSDTIQNRFQGYLQAVQQYGADVVSMSFDYGEATEQQNGTIAALDPVISQIIAAGATMVASSGDYGGLSSGRLGTLWPTSNPAVVSVGGTVLDLDASGQRQSPDVGWHSSSGGISAVYPRPSYQNGVQSVVGSGRGTPDVAMMATGFLSYQPGRGKFVTIDGTSVSAPLFAGVVAMAAQQAGQGLGDVHQTLYGIPFPYSSGSGLVDVTSGTSDVNGQHGSTVPPPNVPGFTGWTAGVGYDLVTGLGTVQADALVPVLAGAQPDPPPQQ
ncbi:S53 family peptidase [Streptomyces sp. NPDC051162]|uniref:S53 family peptidase n=1 Tax=unclassified Streptomyces TaxID=2593676 RepID=UPI0034424B5E